MNASNLTAVKDPSLTPGNGSMVGLFRDLANAVWDQRSDSEVTWSRFRGLFTYCYSPYGISCVAMILILNRVVVLCSNNGYIGSMSRSRVYFRRAIMAAFRVAAIFLLLYRLYLVMIALNLHTHISVDPSLTTLNLPLVRSLFPDKLFAYDPTKADSSMLTPKTQVMVGPTTGMYWDVFVCFCILLTVDVFVSVLGGERPSMRSRITIFEYSLAFQEFSSSEFFYKEMYAFNRPSEQVLVTTLFLLLDHLHVHIGALVNKNRYQLIPSTIIGLGFLSYFISCFLNGTLGGFPFIIVLSHIPQLALLMVISLSAMIILVAFISNGFSTQSFNFAGFFAPGTSGNVQVNHGLLCDDDFQAAILGLGMIAITSAGKSSYISELGPLRADQLTWPERDQWLGGESSQSSLGPYNDGARHYANIMALEPSLNASRSLSQPSTSVFRLRFDTASMALQYMGQLGWGLLQKLLCRLGVHKLIGFSWLNNHQVPPFLEPYIHHHQESTLRDNLVHLDSLSEMDVSSLYLQILNGDALSMDDNLATFTCPIENLDSDFESDSESDSEPRAIDSPSSIDNHRETAIQDLLSGTELTDLLTAQDFEIVRSHMAHDGTGGVMTRARFRKSARNEGQLILGLVASARPQINPNSSLSPGTNNDHDAHQRHLNQLLCVVCQENCREIVTWPCKCFSICESCRLSLVSRGIDGCVCCRRPVEGVSRIFIP